MGKKKGKKQQRGDGRQAAGGSGGQTARQVDAVVVGGLCAEMCPSLLLKVGTDCTIMFSAGSGLQVSCAEYCDHMRCRTNPCNELCHTF